MSTLGDVNVKTFVPYQVTTKGCFGFQKPLFARTSATVDRIKVWMETTGRWQYTLLVLKFVYVLTFFSNAPDSAFHILSDI